jgi:hypothetical protein
MQQPGDENPPAADSQQPGDENPPAAEPQQPGEGNETTADNQTQYCPNGKSVQEDPECDDETESYAYSPNYYTYYEGYPSYSNSLPYYPQFYGNYPTYYGGYYDNSWAYDYPGWNYPGYIYTSPNYYSYGGVYLPYFHSGNFRYWSNWGYPYWRHHDRWWRDHHRVYDRDRHAVVDRDFGRGRDGWNMTRDGRVYRNEQLRNRQMAENQRFRDGRRDQQMVRNPTRTPRRDTGTIRSPTNTGQNRSLWQQPGQGRRTTPLYTSPRRNQGTGYNYNRNTQGRQYIRRTRNNRLGNPMIQVPSRNIYRQGYNNIYGNRQGLYNRQGVYSPGMTMPRDGSTTFRQGYIPSNRRYQQPFYSGRDTGTFNRGSSYYNNRPTFRSSAPRTNFRGYAAPRRGGFGRSSPAIRHHSFSGGRSYGGTRSSHRGGGVGARGGRR